MTVNGDNKKEKPGISAGGLRIVLNYFSTLWKIPIWDMGQEISFNRLYWLCEQFCDLRMAIRQSADPALDLRLAFIRLSHQEIISSDSVKLAEEISMLKRELSQLKNMMRQNPKNMSLEDTQSPVIYTGENSIKAAEESGFCQNLDLDTPFENTAHESDRMAPDEDTEHSTAHDMEGGMHINREEPGTPFVDSIMESTEEDISASDLFNILR